MDFRGFYINLDRATGRGAKLQGNLAALGLEKVYERVPAVDAREAGILGWEACYRSHMKALERGLESGAPLVHVIEDDVILTSHVAPFAASGAAEALTRRFELLYLDMWVDPERVEVYRQAFLASVPANGYAGLSTIDLRQQRVATMASYMVRRETIPRILFFLRAQAHFMKAVDATINQVVAAGGLKAGVVVPFLTRMDPETVADSSIQTMPVDAYRLLRELRAQFCIA